MDAHSEYSHELRCLAAIKNGAGNIRCAKKRAQDPGAEFCPTHATMALARGAEDPLPRWVPEVPLPLGDSLLAAAGTQVGSSVSSAAAPPVVTREEFSSLCQMVTEMRGLLLTAQNQGGLRETKTATEQEELAAAEAARAAEVAEAAKVAAEVAEAAKVAAEAKAKEDAEARKLAQSKVEAEQTERWKAACLAEEARMAAADRAAKAAEREEMLGSLRSAEKAVRRDLKKAQQNGQASEVDRLRRFKSFLEAKIRSCTAIDVESAATSGGESEVSDSALRAWASKSPPRRGRQKRGTKTQASVYGVWAEEFAKSMGTLDSGSLTLVSGWPSPSKSEAPGPSGFTSTMKSRFPNFQPWCWHQLRERSVPVAFVQPEQSLHLLTGQKQIEGVVFTLGAASPTVQTHAWKPMLLASPQAFQHQWDQVEELLEQKHGAGVETRAGRAYRASINSLLVERSWDCKDKTRSMAWYHAACMVLWKVTDHLPVRELTFMGKVIVMPALHKLQLAPDPYNNLAEMGSYPAYVHATTCGKCKLLGFAEKFCPSCHPNLPGAQVAAVARAARMRR